MKDRPTALYRMYDEGGSLLYVGISLRMAQRLSEHRADKEWWPEIGTVKLEHFDQRNKAEEAERHAIARENPRYNIRRPPVLAAPVKPPTLSPKVLKSWYSIREVASAVHQSESVILAAMHAGRVPYEQISDAPVRRRRYRISGEVVDDLMKGRLSLWPPCPDCGSAGPWRNGYSRKAHVASHRPVQCPECGFASTAAGIAGHRVTKHGYRKPAAVGQRGAEPGEKPG